MFFRSLARRLSPYGPIAGMINLAALALLAFVLPARAAPITAPATVTVLAFGDSLTAGYGLALDQSFPAQLQAALHQAGIAARIVNGGVSGDTSADGLARLDWALADRPDAVIVELGANDMLRGLDPARTFANLDAILARLKGKGIPVLLAGMRAAPNMGPDYSRRFDAIYPRLARKYGVALYPFFLDGVAARPALNQPDGMHPNAKGVAVIVRRILPDVKALLRRAATPKLDRGP